MAFGEAHRLRFGSRARLKGARDFASVRQGGQRLVVGCLIANWKTVERGTHSRVGIVTSSRIGPAVVRNRARRLLRETYRLHQFELNGAVDLVLVARRSIIGKGLAEVEKDFLTTLRKAGLLKSGTELEQ